MSGRVGFVFMVNCVCCGCGFLLLIFDGDCGLVAGVLCTYAPGLYDYDNVFGIPNLALSLERRLCSARRGPVAGVST